MPLGDDSGLSCRFTLACNTLLLRTTGFISSRLRVFAWPTFIKKPENRAKMDHFLSNGPSLSAPSSVQDRRPTWTKTEKTIYTIRDEMLDGHTAGFVAGRVFSYRFRRAVFPTVDRPHYNGRTRFCPWVRELNNWRC